MSVRAPVVNGTEGMVVVGSIEWWLLVMMKMARIISARTCYMRESSYVFSCLLFLLFPWRSDGSVRCHASVDVLLFLFGWFQDLQV